MSALAFTDADLAPTRTTRGELDPWRDWREVLLGDEMLVDVSAYTTEYGIVWCRVVGLAPGSAAVYPYKVAVPGRGTGQFRAAEVHGWRRPVWLVEVIRDSRRR